jgi:hypothetical protein
MLLDYPIATRGLAMTHEATVEGVDCLQFWSCSGPGLNPSKKCGWQTV